MQNYQFPPFVCIKGLIWFVVNRFMTEPSNQGACHIGSFNLRRCEALFSVLQWLVHQSRLIVCRHQLCPYFLLLIDFRWISAWIFYISHGIHVSHFEKPFCCIIFKLTLQDLDCNLILPDRLQKCLYQYFDLPVKMFKDT